MIRFSIDRHPLVPGEPRTFTISVRVPWTHKPRWSTYTSWFAWTYLERHFLFRSFTCQREDTKRAPIISREQFEDLSREEQGILHSKYEDIL